MKKKIIIISLASIIILPLVLLFTIRGINAIRFNISGGVQERIYVTLGDIPQALHIRGQNITNPVIIWLHGGPGWSDAYELASWQFMMEEDFTFIRWDQRGSGRTYRRNPEAPLSLDILMKDLDDLVVYAKERFGQPVYIVGDSWGTVLGITYATMYPENIAGYVGIAQNIDFFKSLKLGAQVGHDRALAAGNIDDAEQIMAIYEKAWGISMLDDDFNFEDLALLQNYPAKYHAPEGGSQGLGIFFSPWFGFHEFRDFITVFMIDNKVFFDRNKSLFHALENFSPPEQLDVPVAFIMGGEDFITCTELVVDYNNRLEAPSKNLFIIEDTGHSPYRYQPEVFAETLHEALSKFD